MNEIVFAARATTLAISLLLVGCSGKTIHDTSGGGSAGSGGSSGGDSGGTYTGGGGGSTAGGAGRADDHPPLCGTTGSKPGTTDGGGGTTDGGGGSVEGFVLVEPGTFTMGSPAGELGRVCTEPERGCIAGSGETQHQVTLTQRFYLQRTEVTQAQWRARIGNNPSWRFNACGESCPVGNVNWWEALAYANATSAAEGLAECYTLTGCFGTAGGGMACAGVTVNATGGNPYLCTGYRLPTEAEWEYAYRAGTTTAFYNGGITQPGCCPVDPNLDAIGWFCGNAGGMTHPVAQKAANAWGLYDMAGNLWERVWDGNGDYPSSGVTDPAGPGSGGVRGGSFSNDAASARAAGRSYPDDREYPSGFRLARSGSSTSGSSTIGTGPVTSSATSGAGGFTGSGGASGTGGSRGGAGGMPGAFDAGGPCPGIAPGEVFPGIHVDRATYGANCGVGVGNATCALSAQCDGKFDCSFLVDNSVLGDPAYECAKGFDATWTCPGGGGHSVSHDPVEGEGYTVNLSCP